MPTKAKKALKGKLEFFSETGTEGAFWAFQDERHISYEPLHHKVVHEGARVFGSSAGGQPGRIIKAWKADGRPLPDPTYEPKLDELVAQMQSEGKDISGQDVIEYFERCDKLDIYQAEDGEDIKLQIKWLDGTVEDRSITTLYHQRYEYAGLHYLGNGDQLTIFDPYDPTKVVWQGVIKLKQFPLFTETVYNMWIHSDMVGVDREAWAKMFFEEYPAELVPR